MAREKAIGAERHAQSRNDSLWFRNHLNIALVTYGNLFISLGNERSLTEEEVLRILEEAKRPRKGRNRFPNNSDASLRDHAAISLMYYGGLRADEVGKLRISGLDLDNKKLRVHEGKGKDFSIVNLTQEAVSSVQEYLKKGRSKPRKPEYADVLFLTIRGRPFARNVLWAQVKRIAFWAGIDKNVHPHIFRHSMATHMAERGIPAQMIQAQTRHKSLDMVQRYTHLSDKSVRDAYDHAFARNPPAEKTATPQTEERAQERHNAPAKAVSMRDKLLELVLDGKLTEDKIGRLEKLITALDGPKDKAPHFEGYA